MPLSKPIISIVAPVKVGGAANAGAGLLASAFDHVHPLTETSGPTNMSVADIFAAEAVFRVGSALTGKLIAFGTSGTNLSSTVITAATIAGATATLPKAGTYAFFYIAQYNSAVTTTALQLAAAYSGTVSSFRLRASAQVNATTFESFTVTALNTLGLVPGSGGYAVAGQNGLVLAHGFITVSTSGNFELQFASKVAGSQVQLASGGFFAVVML